MEQQLSVASSRVRPGGRLVRLLGELGVLHPRVRVPVMTFVAMLLVFALERLAMLALLPDRFAGALAIDVLKAFAVGLRFDVVIASTLLIPLVVLVSLATPGVLRKRAYKRVVGWYCGLAVALCGFICIVDFFFFKQFSERLDSRAISYIGEQGNEYLLHMLFTRYPLIPAIGVMLVAAFALAWAFSRWSIVDKHCGFKLWQAWSAPLLIIPLLVLGIRGTVSSHAINTSLAYFSPSPAVSQLALNGGFTLRQAIISSTVKSVDLSTLYPLLEHDEAVRRTLALAGSPQDTFIGDVNNPLRRITHTGRPQKNHNVVLVMLESLSWHYVGALGGDERLTPNLNRLAREGMLFEKCFAVGERTQRGFAGIVSGYPDLPEYSVTTRPETTGHFITLGSVLAKRGYETSFIYAGPGHRDHRQSFLGSNGYNRFVTINDVVSKTFKTKLGYCDEDLFNTADATFAGSKRPFFATLLTLSFHAPFDVPENSVEPVEPSHPFAAQLDCIRYTDQAIGRFIEKAKQREYFEDTIFVFVADHMGGYRENPRTAVTNRVPFLVYAPGIVEPQRMSQVCSQMDIAPTLMWLLGGEYEHSFFGSSALGPGAERRHGFALTDDEELILCRPDGKVAVVPPYGGETKLFEHALPETLTVIKDEAAAAEAKRDAVAILQVAQWVFDHLGHGEPAKR